MASKCLWGHDPPEPDDCILCAEMQADLENPGKIDQHGIERDLDGKPVCRKCHLALADEDGLCPQCNVEAD